jgi:general secretion pathway protein D
MMRNRHTRAAGTHVSTHPFRSRVGLPLTFALFSVRLFSQTAPPVAHNPTKAEDLYLAGARALDRKDLATAEADFAQAAELNPARPEYALALTLAREHRVTELVQQASQARTGGQVARSNELLAAAKKIDPDNEIVAQHLDVGPTPTQFRTDAPPPNEPWFDRVAAISGPIQLVPNKTVQPFALRGDTREVVRQVAAAYGIRASFDDSVTSQQLRFTLDTAPYSQTMPILLRMARLFSVALDQNSILIVKDTPENRLRFERQLQETVFVPGTTVEEINELGNVVRNVFDVKQVTVQPSAGSMVIRAPETTLRAVNYVLSDLIDGGAQVMLDMRLYEVDKTRTRNIGAALPQSIGAFSVVSQAQSLVTANQSTINQAISQGLITLTGNYYTDIAKEALFLLGTGLASSSLLSGLFGVFGGGISTIGVSAPAATISLALNSSEARTIDDIQVRVGDRQSNTFRAGSKYPITTSTYTSGVSTATSSALAGVTINGVSAATLASQYLGTGSSLNVPQIQYEDLGITLKTTPSVERSGLIALKVELKIEALTGQSALGNPILSSRYLTSEITVEEGTPAVLVSALSKTESAAVNGIPVISDLPGFQGIADKIGETDSTELVLTITPHVVRRRSNALASAKIVFNVPAGSDY